jgi:plasmid stabilization system protein ParE
MNLRQVIHPEAQKEFDHAVAWHANQKKGLGRRFATEVKNVLKLLRKMPRIHAIVMDDVRRAVVRNFPYVILYRVTDDEIIVISIFHTSRDPGEWQSRV